MGSSLLGFHDVRSRFFASPNFIDPLLDAQHGAPSNSLTKRLNTSAAKGFDRKAVAPAARAAWRLAREASTVATSTGGGVASARAARTMSRPSPSGSLRSAMTRRSGWAAMARSPARQDPTETTR